MGLPDDRFFREAEEENEFIKVSFEK